MNPSVDAAISHSEQVMSETRGLMWQGLPPVGPTALSELSDAELLLATRRLVGRSNQLLASLLAHLAELEARGIHRNRACASLYTYCIYELRLSEDESYRRVTAARLVRRFPALLRVIAAGELHLTGLLMLGSHLTEENLLEVLARAKHRTKKEIARLVRVLDPLPDVPSRIEPLGPAPARLIPSAPTWSSFVQSTSPVRELTPGDRPRDCTENYEDSPARSEPEGANIVEAANVIEAIERGGGGTEFPRESLAVSPERQRPAPARVTDERYSVQFTANAEYVDLVDRARALLSHSTPRLTLDELHLRALRALVTELERQKYAVTPRTRRNSGIETREELHDARGTPVLTEEGRATDPTSQAPEKKLADVGHGVHHEPQRGGPRQRGRHIPAAIRRAVFERDQGRCTYADPSGRRCLETHALDLHHLVAFALGGEHTEGNLCLRCRTHNTLAAEEDFGKEFIQHARGSNGHDPWPK